MRTIVVIHAVRPPRPSGFEALAPASGQWPLGSSASRPAGSRIESLAGMARSLCTLASPPQPLRHQSLANTQANTEHHNVGPPDGRQGRSLGGSPDRRPRVEGIICVRVDQSIFLIFPITPRPFPGVCLEDREDQQANSQRPDDPSVATPVRRSRPSAFDLTAEPLNVHRVVAEAPDYELPLVRDPDRAVVREPGDRLLVQQAFHGSQRPRWVKAIGYWHNQRLPFGLDAPHAHPLAILCRVDIHIHFCPALCPLVRQFNRIQCHRSAESEGGCP